MRRLLLLIAVTLAAGLVCCGLAASSAAAAPPPMFHPSAGPLALLATQQAELTASDATANCEFGTTVALSGNTALIGAPLKTVAGSQTAGAVYVFVRPGASWSEQTELSDPDSGTGHYFGSAIALSGDIAIVGAPGEGAGGTVYVFTRSGSSWSQSEKLTDPDAIDELAGDEFGTSLALSGDTLLVGADSATAGGSDEIGAVYVYTRSGNSWSKVARLTAADAAYGDSFGSAVALDGQTALVGAPGKTVASQSLAGATYVFSGAGASWSQKAKLADPAPAAMDYFGSRLALSGGTALISTPYAVVSGKQNVGSVYVYTGSGAVWQKRAKLADPAAAANDYFGLALALEGGRALIGAPLAKVGVTSNAGVAYVYTGSGAIWSQQAKLADPDPAPADRFGGPFALSGNTALIGAIGRAVGGQNQAGAVYVEDLGGSPTPVAPKLGKLSPTKGKPGCIVTLTGAHFGATRGTSKVLFAGKAAKKYLSWSDTKIKLRLPPAKKGKLAVKVKTAAGTSNVKYFTRR